MINSNMLPEQIEFIKVYLSKKGIDSTTIDITCNSLQVSGNGNVLFLDRHNNMVNLVLPLENRAMLQQLHSKGLNINRQRKIWVDYAQKKLT